MDRDEAIRKIRAGLQKRSGKPWSVKGGRGTAWGWITIDAPPSRATWSHRLKQTPGVLVPDLPENYEPYDTGKPGHSMSPQDRAELTKLLGLEQIVSFQGESVPASNNHYQEFVDRAEGRTPSVIGKPYWD